MFRHSDDGFTLVKHLRDLQPVSSFKRTDPFATDHNKGHAEVEAAAQARTRMMLTPPTLMTSTLSPPGVTASLCLHPHPLACSSPLPTTGFKEQKGRSERLARVTCMPPRRSTQRTASPPTSPRPTRASAVNHAVSSSPLANRGDSTKLNQPSHVPMPLASAASPRAARGAAENGQALCESLSTSEIKILSLGRILNQPAFHSSKVIFPIGYKSQYLRYPSVSDPSRKVAYTCSVEHTDNKPLFVVQCQESPLTFTGSSPSAAWEAVEASLSEVRRSSARGNKRDVDGMALFGFSSALVAKAISKLPGADEVLAHYAPKPPPPAVSSSHIDSPKRGGAVAVAEPVFSIFNKKHSTYKKPPPLPKLNQGSYRWLEANLEAFEPPVCGDKVEFHSVDDTLRALQSMWQAVAIVNFCRTFKSVIGLPFHMTDLASAFFDAPSSILMRHLHLRLLMPATPKNDTRELCDKENAWLNMLHARMHLARNSSYAEDELLQFVKVNLVLAADKGNSAAGADQMDVSDSGSEISGPEPHGSDDGNDEEFFWSLAFDADPFPGDASSWFTLSLHTKVKMLLLLCEEALGTCELFRSRTSMDEDAEDVRVAPICIDKEGAYYWYTADDSSAAIYKEFPPRIDKKEGFLVPGSCCISAVCNSVEEMTTFATSWKRSKHNDEKKLSEFLLNEEIPRLEGIALSRERSERRQLELELMPRKRSSRIQEVTIKKTREEEEEERRREEERKRREEKEARRLAAEAKAKEEERRLRAEAREAERIKEESERRRMEQERAELRARRLMEREGLLRSDRLHAMKSSGFGSGSEVCSPALQVESAFGGSDIGNDAECHTVTSLSITAIHNGDPAVKKAKISIQNSSSTPGGECAPLSSPAEIKKVVPTPGDLLALATEIKREHPGWGVKRVHLQMLEKHPDWAITEHRVNKCLHENGLSNVRPPCSAATTDANQALTEQHEQTGAAVADIHFDILSLPQTHNSSAEILDSASSPSSPNAGPPQQFADIVDLDKLFKPVTGQHACSAADNLQATDGSATAAAELSKSTDLGNGFAAASAPAIALDSPAAFSNSSSQSFTP